MVPFLMLLEFRKGTLYMARCAMYLLILFRLLLRDLHWLADALPLHGERVVIHLVYMVREQSRID